jgi:hypothetical protein
MIKLQIDGSSLERLKRLTSVIDYHFLGFSVDLQEGLLTDNLRQESIYYDDYYCWLLSNLLINYSNATLRALSGNLVKLGEFPDGLARENGFIKTAIAPIAETFGDNPAELPIVANRFGGKTLELGDASTEIPSLKGIPLTYILYGAGEFPASANILFDQSAIDCLPLEALVVLGELTTARLIEAKNTIKADNHKHAESGFNP